MSPHWFKGSANHGFFLLSTFIVLHAKPTKPISVSLDMATGFLAFEGDSVAGFIKVDGHSHGIDFVLSTSKAYL